MILFRRANYIEFISKPRFSLNNQQQAYNELKLQLFRNCMPIFGWLCDSTGSEPKLQNKKTPKNTYSSFNIRCKNEYNSWRNNEMRDHAPFFGSGL